MRLANKDPRLNEQIDEIEEMTSRQIAVLEKITEEKISLVNAAMPHAAPMASAAVVDIPNGVPTSRARPVPRKIAGNTGPPRKPAPSEMA